MLICNTCEIQMCITYVNLQPPSAKYTYGKLIHNTCKIQKMVSVEQKNRKQMKDDMNVNK